MVDTKKYMIEQYNEAKQKILNLHNNEISLYRTEERVINAYDNFKNVARKVEENSGEPTDNTDKGIKTSPVPKRVVFIGRINPKESFMK